MLFGQFGNELRCGTSHGAGACVSKMPLALIRLCSPRTVTKK